MLYLTCTTITSIDLAHYGVSRAKDWVSVKCGTISRSGQEWTLPAQLGQLKTGQDGKGLLQIHLWCPDDLPRLWNRTENRIKQIVALESLIRAFSDFKAFLYI